MLNIVRSLSLQKKLIGGFSFVSLICLLVGLAGQWGTKQLSQDMEAITQQDVPVLEAILSLNNSLETMKSSERTLLDGTLSFQQRKQEYQLIDQAKSEAEKAIKTIDQLLHEGEERQLWKNFLANWQSWQPHLQQFLALSGEFDAQNISNPADLALDAQQKLSSYQEWAIQLSENIMDAVEISVEKDPLQTEIGLWVQELESKNERILKAKGELTKQLQAVGDSMVMIFDYFEIEEPELAQDIFALEIKPSVLAVKESIQHILDPIAEALQVHSQMQEQALQTSAPVLNTAQQELQKMVMSSREAMNKSSELATERASEVATILWFTILLGIVSAVLLGVFLTRSITRPLTQTVSMLEELEMGHINHRLNLNRSDEIGRMAAAMDRFADSLQNEIVEPLQQLAQGDLTFEAHPRDDQDVLRKALQQLGTDLNDMISQILATGSQISAGSIQVADASQTLSQGATKSASSLEEISSSMNEIGSQTNHSADNAAQANQLAKDASKAADSGSQHMVSMINAMGEINEAGQNINKIIKVIDEIAFQTNLLALNAAVEAARAGQHGKGFAVVAEEVRNLAARSAKAASETAQLIEGSVEKATNGTQIAERTSGSLNKIVSSITKVDDLLEEIAAASKEQATGVAQVNLGLQQIDQVIQQNTAGAEESAATSEELSNQASQLQQMLQRFQLKEEKSPTVSAPLKVVRPNLANIAWESLPNPSEENDEGASGQA